MSHGPLELARAQDAQARRCPADESAGGHAPLWLRTAHSLCSMHARVAQPWRGTKCLACRQPSTVRMPFSLLLLLLLILLRALLVVATSAVAFATLATAMCRGAPGALILAHARMRLLSRQVHLASVLQRRVPQPLHLATVPRRRVPQLLQPQLRCHVGACLSRSNLLSVPRRRVPQLLHPATVPRQRVPQPLHPATVPRQRVPQPLQPATVPRRRVPQLLQPATVPRRRVPLGSCSSQAADWPPACFCCA